MFNSDISGYVPTIVKDQIEKIYEEGFVSNGTDEYGHYCYIRKELLEQ